MNDALLAPQPQAELAKVAAELRAELDRLKATLDNPTPSVIREVDAGIVTATRLGENVFGNVYCRRCKMHIGMLVGSSKCPSCGAPIGAS
jgi:hypothetical protein